jgi:hypothetical protein
MDTKEFIDMIDMSGHVARSYSGRGMMGRSCVGVECDNTPVEFIVNLLSHAHNVSQSGEDCFDSVAELMYNYRVDQLGMGEIIYFPRIKWEGE